MYFNTLLDGSLKAISFVAHVVNRLLARSRGPDEFWRKRKIFKLASHFLGRRRNCYSLAIRSVHRALLYSTQGRKLKKEDMHELWLTRSTAAIEEHADLAVWEPRTFKSLAVIANARAEQDGFSKTKPDLSTTVITNGLIK
ncbi:hypothetical protein KPH14_009828 [Odynerus spinipes]|uniref:Ribosomal protein L20 n=1 Tax=Odynerus spinipes TaxID=1348599 RepID=A0AAD9VTY1_9HYME|nr:hypothetical protein KPH14_009828 [Odynerus spinipes]